MGTRSLTKIYNDENKLLVTMYRQMDGYPSGHGTDLTEFIKDMKIINGINDFNIPNQANGMGCLAAQIIAHFKTQVGGFYIVTGNDHWQDYIYEVRADSLTIREPRKTIFKGSWSDAYVYCTNSK